MCFFGETRLEDQAWVYITAVMGWAPFDTS
jgi:hypothetical protein